MDSGFVPFLVIVPLVSAFLIPLLAKLWPRFADLVGNAAGGLRCGQPVDRVTAARIHDGRVVAFAWYHAGL